MRTTTISEENYSCLSYTWQPVKPRHNIEINGKRVDVGENLYQFLYAARSTNITNPLWIDALCINQSHEREKNHQVSQMGDIYKMSDKVFVWLGVLDSTMVKFLDEMGRVQHDSEE
jgi:hypothetical protein